MMPSIVKHDCNKHGWNAIFPCPTCRAEETASSKRFDPKSTSGFSEAQKASVSESVKQWAGGPCAEQEAEIDKLKARLNEAESSLVELHRIARELYCGYRAEHSVFEEFQYQTSSGKVVTYKR